MSGGNHFPGGARAALGLAAGCYSSGPASPGTIWLPEQARAVGASATPWLNLGGGNYCILDYARVQDYLHFPQRPYYM